MTRRSRNNSSLNAVDAAAIYATKRALDPRTFGYTGGADDSAALAACVAAAGPGGAMELPPQNTNYQATTVLPTGFRVYGVSAKGSVLSTNLDIPCFTNVGGEGVTVENLKIANSYTGVRTTFDIDFTNPFHCLLEKVEFALSQSATGNGGYRFLLDNGQAGAAQAFMPRAIDCWVRNGRAKVDGVTDCHIRGGWIWGTYTGAVGALELVNCSNFNLTDCDIVPTVNGGIYIGGTGLSNLTISGGLMDGSYSTIQTGYGIVSSGYIRGFTIKGVKFWNLWQGALNLNNVRNGSIHGNVFSLNNRGNANYHDINMVGSLYNTFVSNTFSQTNAALTNLGLCYNEDATSGHNVGTANTVELNAGATFYDSRLAVVQPSTLWTRNVAA